MSFEDWLQVAIVCLLGAMSPGPSLLLVIRTTTAAGRFQGVMVGVGHGLGVGLYALIAATGLALILAAAPSFYSTVSWLGAGFLAWLGFQLWKASLSKKIDKNDNATVRRANGFVQGFAIAFLNPKIAAFFLALFSQFVRPEAGGIEKGLMAVTAGLIDMGWYVLVALMLTGSGLVYWLRKNNVLVDRAMGSLLLLIAGGLVYDRIFSF